MKNRFSQPDLGPGEEAPELQGQGEILSAVELLEQHGGDINEAVKAAQRAAGVEIDEAWWDEHVVQGRDPNKMTTKEMAEAFDAAFPGFVSGAKNGGETDDEAEAA